MSRIAKAPIDIPQGVEVTVNGSTLQVKGVKGVLQQQLPPDISVQQEDSQLKFSSSSTEKSAIALSGTLRALASNMVEGVSKGFSKKLELRGVGYRAQVQGKKVNLTLGYSHPVVYDLPEGITVESPSQTELLIQGFDKQRVGQVAAEIRSLREPENYKGKGVRYSDEHVIIKETKKK